MSPRLRPSSSARSYTGSRDHRKLGAIVLALGLAVLLFQYFGRPGAWAWFHQLTAPNAQRPVDNVLRDQPQLGEVVVAQAGEARPDNNKPAVPEGAEKKLFPGITEEMLEPIRDDAAFSAAEHEPFFQMLHLLKDHPSEDFAPFVKIDIPYTQLYAQPKAYRGEVVKVKGLLRAAYSDLRAAPNPFGIKTYHQLWVSPLDRPKHEVFAVYCLELPPEMPRGDTPADAEPGEVELTGFYFKRWAYRAKDENLRSTPLVLAKTVSWSVPVAPAPAIAPLDDRVFIKEISIAVIVALVVCGAVVWYVTRKPAVDPRMARWMALASRRKTGRGALEELRNMEVSPEVLASLHMTRSSSPNHSRTPPADH